MTFDVYGPIRTDTEIQWKRSNSKRLSRIWYTITGVDFFINIAILVSIIVKYIQPQGHPLEATLIIVNAFLMCVILGTALFYDTLLSDNNPEDAGKIIHLINRAMFYPDFKALLGNYFNVRDYLTREEYAAINHLVYQAELETQAQVKARQWESQKAQLYK